jgi:hypothetical protein
VAPIYRRADQLDSLVHIYTPSSVTTATNLQMCPAMPSANRLGLQLWCLVKGDESIFRVTVPSAANVELIHRKKEIGSFSGLDLFKVWYGTLVATSTPRPLFIGRYRPRVAKRRILLPQFQRRVQRHYTNRQCVGILHRALGQGSYLTSI